MPSSFSPLPRVLCITLRPGSVGHAVLDGFGVPSRSFFTSRFDHLARRERFDWLVRLLRSSCRRFQPTHIVLGLPNAPGPERLTLAKQLARRLIRSGIAVSIRRLRDAAAILVGPTDRGRAHELVKRLAEHFVPDLGPLVERARKALAWYWRPAWYALAIALAVLVEHHPRVAAAVARPSAFLIEPFRRAVMAAEHRLAPLTV